MKQKYFWRVLISIDQGFNVVLSPALNWGLNTDKFGYPDETLSSVFGKETSEGKCKVCYFVCRVLNVFDPNHCKKSIEADEGNKVN